MKNSFDIIDDILCTKSTARLLPGDDCSAFILNKGISFYSPQYTSLINQTSNIYGKILDNQQLVNYLRLIFPISKRKKGTWISSKKQKTENHNMVISQLSKSLELSKKEIEDMIDIFPEILNDYTEEEKTFKRLET